VVVRSKVVDQAIAASGGLAEAFTLPLTLVVPAILLGAVGGVFGALSKQHRRVTFS
jgi:hypothetical protein